MRLESVRITEFKSIRDTTTFKIGDITCLVGKNESGKTAVLQALYRLNPIVPEQDEFDVTDDYPRVDVEDYRQSIEDGSAEPANVETAKFVLEDDDLRTLVEELGSSALREPSVTLEKGYSNTLIVTLPIDEAALVQTLAANAHLPEAYSEASSRPDITSLAAYLDVKNAECQRAMAEATAKANAIPDATEKAAALVEAAKFAPPATANALRARLTTLTSPSLTIYIWEKHLREHFPRFLYFDEYYLLDGHVNIEALKARQAGGQLWDSDRPMLGLLELARLKLDELTSASRTEDLISKLEGASNHLSKLATEYWSQNRHLLVQFQVLPARPSDPPGLTTGTNLWGRVNDSVHHVTTLLGSRSKGFVWFFSFLAWFSQQKKTKGPIILLLDEPGLFLHGRAQADLLRFIDEQLSPRQVVYTTHSPFMVDPTRFDRVRIVQDLSMDAAGRLPKDEQGTKVLSDVLHASTDSLFPLQGALGYDIAQSLFVGPFNLVVEGVSDLLYLQTMSAILEQSGREGLNKKWTITPVGGSDKIPTFVALLGAQRGLKIATLIDVQRKDEQKIENLYRAKLLKKNHVLTFAQFVGKREADVEDMFEPSFYLSLLESEYAVPNPLAVTVPGNGRIVPEIEKYLEASPLPNGAKFNHYRPARRFAEGSGTLATKLSGATLGRFETAF